MALQRVEAGEPEDHRKVVLAARQAKEDLPPGARQGRGDRLDKVAPRDREALRARPVRRAQEVLQALRAAVGKLARPALPAKLALRVKLAAAARGVPLAEEEAQRIMNSSLPM